MVYKCNHRESQNEILNTMSLHVLRKKLSEMHECRYFVLIVDEYTDISNTEQISLWVRTVDKILNVKKYFLDSHKLDNIKNETIVRAIKSILIRFHLKLDNWGVRLTTALTTIWGKILVLRNKSPANNQKR